MNVAVRQEKHHYEGIMSKSFSNMENILSNLIRTECWIQHKTWPLHSSTKTCKTTKRQRNNVRKYEKMVKDNLDIFIRNQLLFKNAKDLMQAANTVIRISIIKLRKMARRITNSNFQTV